MATGGKALKFAEIRQREEFVEALRDKDVSKVIEFCYSSDIRWVIIQTLANFNSGVASDIMCRIIIDWGIDETAEAIGPDKRSQIYATDQVLSYTLATIGFVSNRDLPVTKLQHQRSVLKIMSAGDYDEVARAVTGFYIGTCHDDIGGYIGNVELMDLPVVAGVLVQVSEHVVELSDQALLVVSRSPRRQLVTQVAIRAILHRILHSLPGNQREQIATMFGVMLSITEPAGS